jgi:hypothetical protein
LSNKGGILSTPSNCAISADEIDITLFREILLLPFTIDPVDTADLRLRTGRQRMEAAAAILSGSNWEKIDNRACHLPEDRDIPKGECEAQRAKRLRSAYEEFVYFEPFVRKFLYSRPERSRDKDKDKDPITLFARKDVGKLEVGYERVYSLDGGDKKARVVRRYTFIVERCNLYLFETGNALLALEVAFESVITVGPLEGVPAKIRDNATRMTLVDCQVVLENLRRVFPPYFTETDGQLGNPAASLEAPYFARSFTWHRRTPEPTWPIDVSVSAETQIGEVFGPAGRAHGKADVPQAPPMFEPWRKVLEPLLVEGGSAGPDGQRVRLSQIGDDRAFVMAQIGVRNAFQIKDSDWVRLCYCDAPGSGFSYAKGFLKNFKETNCYDRFFDVDKKENWQSTRYLMCNYAFLMVGSCVPANKGKNDWFRHLFSRHFRRHYFQLVMISLLHKVALLSLSNRLAKPLDSSNFEEEAEITYRDILNFTHRYWFEEISAQIQGHELFTMLRQHLRTREMYNQLSQEVRETTARLAVVRQDRLNRVAGVGLGAAVFVGIFGMNIFDDGEYFLGNIPTWFFTLVFIVIAGLTWFGYRNGQSDWRRINYWWRRYVQPHLQRWWRWLVPSSS